MRTAQDLSDIDSISWDVAVIGAGIAGSVMARELSREGLKVLLIEKKRFPRAKVCGACLNGLALSVLDHLGLTDRIRAAGGVPLHSFFSRQSGRKLNVPFHEGLAISRTVLDPILAEAASESGVRFMQETTASLNGTTENGCRVNLEQHGEKIVITAKAVIVAAGLAPSILSNHKEFSSEIQPNSKIGAGCIIENAPKSYGPGVIYMAVGKGGYVGMVRVEENHLDIASAFDASFLKQQESPGQAARSILQESGFEAIPGIENAKWLGTPSLTRRSDPLAMDRVFLLGDSAGYVEPFTGEGMGWALASVILLKPIVLKAVAGWRTEYGLEWKAAYDDFVGNRQRLCKLLARSLARPIISTIAFRCVGIVPGLTGRMVSFINAPFEFGSERVVKS